MKETTQTNRAKSSAVSGRMQRLVRPLWLVQVKGQKCSESWEISVVREDNHHGQRSWGWFGNTKLLVSHNGGPCNWPIVEYVWDQQIRIANELCDKLNAGEIVLPNV